MSVEEKFRRRLLPFVVEGKITQPIFSDSAAQVLVATVHLLPAVARQGRSEALKTALQHAIADLGASVRLIVETG